MSIGDALASESESGSGSGSSSESASESASGSSADASGSENVTAASKDKAAKKSSAPPQSVFGMIAAGVVGAITLALV